MVAMADWEINRDILSHILLGFVSDVTQVQRASASCTHSHRAALSRDARLQL